jgi:hypothetical protein
MRVIQTVKTHEHYRKNALAFCVAAQKLDSEDTDAFIAPSALCLAFAIELFLKCVLLKAGKTAKDLGKPPYGHDLWSMWNMPELGQQRQQAMLHAEHCFQDIRQDGAARYPTPAPDTFDRFLEDLGNLHSAASGMQIRYPMQGTNVPPISLMACVFERLIRAEEYETAIARR